MELESHPASRSLRGHGGEARRRDFVGQERRTGRAQLARRQRLAILLPVRAAMKAQRQQTSTNCFRAAGQVGVLCFAERSEEAVMGKLERSTTGSGLHLALLVFCFVGGCGEERSGEVGVSALGSGLVTASPGSQPRPHDDEAAYGRLKSNLRSGAASRLTELLAANPGTEHTISFGEDGRLEYAHAAELLSTSCSEALAKYPRYSEQWFSDAVACFLQQNHELFMDSGAGLDFTFLLLTQVGDGAEPGEKLVTIEQRHQGLLVKPAGLKMFFQDGHLTHVAGRVYDPRRFAPKPYWDARIVEAQQRARLGQPVKHFEDYYDADTNRFVSTVLDTTTIPPAYHDVDPVSGTLLASRPAADGFNFGIQPIGMSTHDYQDLFHLDPAKVDYRGTQQGQANTFLLYSPVASSPVPVTLSCLHNSSGVCTSACFFDFTFPGIYPGFADFDLPSNVYTADAMNNDVVVQAFSQNCSNPFWTDTSFSFPNLRFEAVNDFNSLYRLAQMKNNPFSYLNQGTYSQPHTLKLKVQTVDTGGGGGIYTAFDSRISMEFRSSPYNDSAAQLLTVAHEYGHHIHHGYGYFGTSALREGWADAFAARWPIYAYGVTHESPYLTYATPLLGPAGRQLAHDSVAETAQNGEFEIGLSGGIDTNTYYRDRTLSSCYLNNTFNENAGAFYDCMRPMAQIYYELAWNSCHVSYDTCSYGLPIASPVNFGFTPWMLANSAFAFALAMTTASSNVGTFLLSANSRYADFANINYIDAASLSRVNSVFEHHCAGKYGWGGVDNACDTSVYHRLPGSHFASAYSVKAPGFMEAEAGITDPQNVISTQGFDASASKFVGLIPNKTLQVSSPTGAHGFWLAVRKPVTSAFTGPLTVTFTGPGGVTTYSTGSGLNISTTAWMWLQLPPLTLSQSTVVFKNQGGGPLNIDAIWIR